MIKKRRVPKSIEEINENIICEKFEWFAKQPWCRGIMLWGSRATGFGASDSDWDALIYVTDEYFDSLKLEETLLLEYDESVEPKRLVIDFSPISDKWFKIQINSPLDIDHFAYAEGVTIYDPTGELEEWRQRLARYPEEEHTDRLKNKYLLMIRSFGYAMIDYRREFELDSRINLYRSVVAAVNLWFTIKRSWTPPLKWWSKHAREMGMTDETYEIFRSALVDTNLESVKSLISHLKQMILDEGFEFPNDTLIAFLETIHPNGRAMQIKHSYL